MWRMIYENYNAFLKHVEANCIAPFCQLPILRLKLCRTVLNARHREKYARNMFYNLRRIFHSKLNHEICTHTKICYGLDTFTVMRGSKIQDIIKPRNCGVYLNNQNQLISRLQQQTLEICKQMTSDRARFLKEIKKPGMYCWKQQFVRYYSAINQFKSLQLNKKENTQSIKLLM